MISTQITQNITALGPQKLEHKQEHLNHSTGNILFIAAIVATVCLSGWMTRGIRGYRDITTCCATAIGMTPLTVMYFTLGNGMINGGLGINKDAETCAVISTIMMSAYFTLKMYMGVFFFMKLREIVHMVTKGDTRAGKRGSAKGSFYYVFLPLLLVFLACTIPSILSIETSLKMRDIPHPGKATYCVFTLSRSHLLIPLFGFITTAASATFTLSFLYSSPLFARNVCHHPSSPTAGIAALLSSIVPFTCSICFFARGGKESVSLVQLACAVDVVVMHVLVWAAEGQWSMRNNAARMKVCKCTRLPSQLLGGRTIEERRARVQEVREMHRALQLEEEMLLRSDDGEDEACFMDTSLENRRGSVYKHHYHDEKSSVNSSECYSSSPDMKAERG